PCGPGLLCVSASGTGTATHLGNLTESATLVIDLKTRDSAGCIHQANAIVYTAANGDELHVNVASVNCPTGPLTSHSDGTYTIAGGTGRFADAVGTGTSTVDVDSSSGQKIATTVFDGTINY